MSHVISLIPVGILVTGLLGSIHCIGMCGPLVLACTQTTADRIRYQIGRLIGYLLLGFLIGQLGQTLFQSEHKKIQITAGVLVATLLLYIGLQRLLPRIQLNTPTRLWSRALIYCLTSLKKISTSFSWLKTVGMGFGTAFLPCGFLYGIVLASALTENPLKGAHVLFFFWLGTLPALTFAPEFFRKKIQNFKHISPVLISVVFFISSWVVFYIKVLGIASNTHSCH